MLGIPIYCLIMLATEENTSLDLQQNFIDKIVIKGLGDGDFHHSMTSDDFFEIFRTTLMGVLTQWSMSKENEELVVMGKRAMFPLINLMKKQCS